MIERVDMEWYFGFDNEPHPIVVIDKLPQWKELIFASRPASNGRLWFAEHEGYVRFFYESFTDHEGYGGRTFTLRTAEGPVTLRGPWSSNSFAIVSAGFPASVEVSIRETSSPYDAQLAGAWRVDDLMQHLPRTVAVDWLPIRQGFSTLDLSRDQAFVTNFNQPGDPDGVLVRPRFRPSHWSYEEFYIRRRICRIVKPRGHATSLESLRTVPVSLVTDYRTLPAGYSPEIAAAWRKFYAKVETTMKGDQT